MVKLRLLEMTHEEKLVAFEELWADLRGDGQEFQSPSWHGAELEETEKRVADGREKFLSWEKAKASLRTRVA